jgi:threonine dehydrogenase-like Zn-dependent dehydrogenase
MKMWKLVSPCDLKPSECPEPTITKADEAKIKISEVLLDSTDFSLYNGTAEAQYPFAPGRYAVGKITQLPENYTGILEKSNRVFIDPHFPDKNFKGDSTALQGMDSVKIAGMTCNGFLYPYIVAPQDNLYVLPDSVTDESALFIYTLALALAGIDNLGEIKGKYIAVFGANALGVILCDMLAYYQAVPILVDSRTARLDFARRAGVTYAFLNDDSLDAHINSITGAAFADGAIYVPSGNTIVNTAVFRVTAPGKNVVFCGVTSGALQANLEVALRKQLHLLGVSVPRENISSAINLLANKVINVKPFLSGTYPIGDLPKAYKDAEKIDEKELPHERMVIIDCYGKL